ncbi:MAG TPA: hypothetical protein VH593_09555 [Ktedonobacteraceae bacterium]
MTTTSEYSTMIAVFVNHDQANRAIDNLRHAGYSYDQIRLVRNGPNNFMENLKSLFTGQTTASTNSANDWMRIGVPEQDAHNYQSELDSGRSIVLIRSIDTPEQAFAILRQSGAYDLSSRLRTAPPAMAPEARNPNAAPGTYNPNEQQGMYNPNAQQGMYNPNAQQGMYNPNAQQGAYNSNVTPEMANSPDEQQGAYDSNEQQGANASNVTPGMANSPNERQEVYNSNVTPETADEQSRDYDASQADQPHHSAISNE